MRWGKRWGRFKISGYFVAEMVERAAAGDRDTVGGLLEFMSQCFIVRAHDAPSDDTIEYWAVSPLFDEVAEAEPIPEYQIEMRRYEACDCGGTEFDYPGPPDEPAPRVCQACGKTVDKARVIEEFLGVRRVRTGEGPTLQTILRNDLETILAKHLEGLPGLEVMPEVAAKQLAPAIRGSILARWVKL